MGYRTTLPSRTELEIPEGLEEQVLEARRTHSRFGQYWKQIDRKIPTERDELTRLCWKLGLPGDFDVAQITWRPDYDPYFYEQLVTRAGTMFLFRDEYIFDLQGSVAVEGTQGRPGNLCVYEAARHDRMGLAVRQNLPAGHSAQSRQHCPIPGLHWPRCAWE